LSFETWVAFCLTEGVLCFTPGPAVLLVVSYSVSGGQRAGIAAALGILAANTFYFALSAVGVGALLLASHDLFRALQWGGAIYLVLLGLRMLLASRALGEAPPPADGRAFWCGVVVQGANPKSLVFFTALLPQFMSSDHPVAPQVLVLGVSSVAIEVFALAVYAASAARAGRWAGGRFRGLLDRVGGAFLIAAGLRLAAVREP
jgi:homoserine/homoserine lactone efflux protein